MAPYGSEGKTRPVVQTGSYGENIGQVVLSVDRASGEVTVDLATNVSTKSTLDIATLRGFNAATETAYQIILDAMRHADAEGSKVTGRISASITRAYTTGDYVDGKFTLTAESKEDRGDASPLGTLVSNMLRDRLSSIGEGADFGVTNPGGLRTDLIYNEAVDGNITVAQARSVLPFNNELSIVTMTGDQIYTMLEQQWSRNQDGTAEGISRPVLYLGLSDNVRYTYHEIADPINRGKTKGVIDSVFIDGKQIDRAGTYRAATFTFLASGSGDYFWVFGQTPKVNTGLLDYEQWLAYLASESGEQGISPDFTKQGIRVELDPADAKLKAGDTLKVKYSKLNIHAVGAPENPTAQLTVTTPSGVQTLQGQVANVKDDAGFFSDSVSFDFTVPQDVKSGSLVLDLTASPTNSVATTFGTVTAKDTPVPDPDPKPEPKPEPKPDPKPETKPLPKTGLDSSLIWFLIAGVGATAAGAGIAVRSRRS